jgi:multidrug resistance efflux pump
MLEASKKAYETTFDSVNLINEKKKYKQFLYVIYAFIFLFFITMILPWRQNVRSNGTVTALSPEDRPQTINVTIGGMITKWYVNEGQFIKKGDTIASISEIKDKYFDPAMIKRTAEQVAGKENMQSSMKNKVQSLQTQIAALRNGLSLSEQKGRNKVKQNEMKLISDSIDYEAAKINYEIAEKQFNRFKELHEKGIRSLTDLENRRLKFQESNAKLISAENKLGASKQELMNSKIELRSILADYTDKISKAESELNSAQAYIYDTDATIAKMRNELTSLEIRSSFYHIRSPQDGFVVRALKEGVGEILKEGEPIITVMPHNPQLAVELFVKAMDVPLLKIGDHVRLQFDGWPAIQFSGWPNAAVGTFGGKIQVIDYTPGDDGMYRMLVIQDNLSNDKSWPEQVRQGSGVYGWTLLNTVPVWFELWRQINGFPPGMKPKPKNEKNKTKKFNIDYEVE